MCGGHTGITTDMETWTIKKFIIISIHRYGIMAHNNYYCYQQPVVHKNMGKCRLHSSY